MAATFTGQPLRPGAGGFGEAARSRIFNARQPARRAADDLSAGLSRT